MKRALTTKEKKRRLESIRVHLVKVRNQADQLRVDSMFGSPVQDTRTLRAAVNMLGVAEDLILDLIDWGK